MKTGMSDNKLDLKLEHCMGYNGSITNSLILHPNLVDYIYIAGGVIIIAEMNDPNKQNLLRGHDDEVTCLALSHNGKLLASGQKGVNSDIIVWNYQTRTKIYNLSEHDYAVTFLSFSKDDKLLYSNGSIQDKKIFVWDMETGNIVANHPLFPAPTNCISWGGMIKDNRGQSTDNYLYASCGDSKLVLWSLDPFKGQAEKEIIQTGNYVREYISLAFSLQEQKYLYAGSTSGDIISILVKNRMVVFSKIICAQGVTSIIPLTVNQIIVGGGDGSIVLLYVDEPKCEELARIKLFGSVYSLSASLDGIQLLASTDKGFIYRIRSADLSNILLNENHTDSILNFYSLNDKFYRFGTCSLDGTIRLWTLQDYSVYSRISLSHATTPLSLCFTDEILLSGWTDEKIRCYGLEDIQCKLFIN
jgi:WD40 repeat protein